MPTETSVKLLIAVIITVSRCVLLPRRRAESVTLAKGGTATRHLSFFLFSRQTVSAAATLSHIHEGKGEKRTAGRKIKILSKSCVRTGLTKKLNTGRNAVPQKQNTQARKKTLGSKRSWIQFCNRSRKFGQRPAFFLLSTRLQTLRLEAPPGADDGIDRP